MGREFKKIDYTIPNTIRDFTSGLAYQRGRYLGSGAFAKCYELSQIGYGRQFAGKIVNKAYLKTTCSEKKILDEINVHRHLDHPNIVRMYAHFSDSSFYYIILELCKYNTLLELQERRNILTVPEARCMCKQISEGVNYLHSRHIIHRDLKLNNIFLTDRMQVKIGDFGLAVSLSDPREKRMTMCGTPNYIAPEVLNKIGHSFEVDIWAIGCILYTLLVGKPPFETYTVFDVYEKIKKNQYTLPESLNSHAKKLIKKMLSPNPCKRPTIKEILEDEFLTNGYCPPLLPVSCSTMAPNFDKKLNLLKYGRGHCNIVSEFPYVKEKPSRRWDDMEFLNLMRRLLKYLKKICSSDRKLVPLEHMDNGLHPRSGPIYFCKKWVDYTEKYGLGYELSDSSMGVLFNDKSRIVVDAAFDKIQYIDIKGNEEYFKISETPKNLEKKIKLLKYFKNFMKNKLAESLNVSTKDEDDIARLPVITKWVKNETAIAFYLSNGTIQINFFEDHLKVIACPYMKAISIINKSKELKTYKLRLLELYGWNDTMDQKMKYLIKIIEGWLPSKRKLEGDENSPPVTAKQFKFLR